MLCSIIIDEIEKYYPVTLAEEWDNVGLLVGDRNAEIKKILVALDVTDETVEQAIKVKADLIVTHHPLLFKPIGRVTMQERSGRRILKMAAHHISYYAMHTNFDIGGMADLNAKELALCDTEPLEVTGADQDGKTYGLGKIGSLSKTMTVRELAEYVKSLYRLDVIRVYGDTEKEISRVAVCSGSGRSLIKEALSKKAEVYITGDLDYHTSIDTVAEGLILLDAGHYGTEFGFIPFMAEKLRGWFPEIEVEEALIKQPYEVI